jgi:hypothetical protein
MAATFTSDEEAEIELMLWEYDRDGRIAIDNFFRREPELSLRMAGGIIPKRIVLRPAFIHVECATTRRGCPYRPYSRFWTIVVASASAGSVSMYASPARPKRQRTRWISAPLNLAHESFSPAR